jgi:hypothetical protein
VRFFDMCMTVLLLWSFLGYHSKIRKINYYYNIHIIHSLSPVLYPYIYVYKFFFLLIKPVLDTYEEWGDKRKRDRIKKETADCQKMTIRQIDECIHVFNQRTTHRRRKREKYWFQNILTIKYVLDNV